MKIPKKWKDTILFTTITKCYRDRLIRSIFVNVWYYKLIPSEWYVFSPFCQAKLIHDFECGKSKPKYSVEGEGMIWEGGFHNCIQYTSHSTRCLIDIGHWGNKCVWWISSEAINIRVNSSQGISGSMMRLYAMWTLQVLPLSLWFVLAFQPNTKPFWCPLK